MQTRDGELVKRSQEGDRASFDILVREHYSLVYNIAYRMLGDHDRAADATQSAMVRAYKALSRFRQDATFSTWLYRIVTNVCLDELRQKERGTQSLTLLTENSDTELEERDIPDSKGDPAADAEQRERQELVQEALGRLASEHRAVVVMYDLSGLSYEEMAETLEIPLGTVKSRLNRARHALKEELAADMELFQ